MSAAFPLSAASASAAAPDPISRLLAGATVEARVAAAQTSQLLTLLLGETALTIEAPAATALMPGDRVAAKLVIDPADAALRKLALVPLTEGEGIAQALPSWRSLPGAPAPIVARMLSTNDQGAPASAGASKIVETPAWPAKVVVAASGTSLEKPAAAAAGNMAIAAAAQLAAHPRAAASTLATRLANRVDPVSADIGPDVARFPTQPSPASLREALLPILRAAVARQDSLAPLLADLRSVANDPNLEIAPPLRAAIDRVLRLPIDPTRLQLDATLKDAVARSGVFLENSLATQAPAGVIERDAKAALLILRQALSEAAQRATPVSMNETKSGELPAPHQASSPRAAPRPPLRGEIIPPQLPAAPSIGADAPPREIFARLLVKTDAALDRVTLLQFASMNESSLLARGAESARETLRQWQVELPMAMQQGVGILPLAIERESPRHSRDAAADLVWRMRFALESDELGAIDVAIAWRGGQADVRFWADRDETATLIRANRETLAKSLEAAELSIEGIACNTGRRPAPEKSAPRGQFLDCQS